MSANVIPMSEYRTETVPSAPEAERGILGVGGMSGLTALYASLPAPTPGRPYHPLGQMIETVKEKAALRYLRSLGNSIETQIAEPDAKPENVVANLLQKVAEFQTRSGYAATGLAHLSDLIKPQLVRFENFHLNQSDTVPSSIAELDRNLWGGGFARRMMHVVAARPAAGKTSLVLDVIAGACRAGKRVFFVSLDMPRDVIIDRMFAAPADVPRWKIQSGMDNISLAKLTSTAEYFDGWDLTIQDRAASVADITATWQSLDRQKQVDLIVIDYLQIMTAGPGKRYEQITNISLALRELANRSNAALVVLSQLNRGAQDEEPELWHLRDSGQIEQDARTVLMLWGERDPNDKDAPRSIKLKCAKQGEGPLFTIDMYFQQPLMTFRRKSEIYE